jgi:RNA polymerase sigma-70 factor, ECF subfamily
LGRILAVNQALKRLDEIDHRQAQVVEMRFFGALSVEEVAEALGVAARTIRRDWNLARAWLYGELSGSSQERQLSAQLMRPGAGSGA